MRVCQFRHFGKWTALRGSPAGQPVEKECLPILQTRLCLSIGAFP